MMQETHHNPSSGTFQEFSPRKTILQVQHLGAYILSKWKLILLVSIVAGIAGGVKSYLKKATYTAEITFTLDEGMVAGTGVNELSALGMQLGIGSPNAAGGIFSSMSNIVELMQSRLLIGKTLRKPVNNNEPSVLFADFFLDSLHYREKWMKGSPYYHTDFRSAKGGPQEIIFQNNIIENIYAVLTSQYLKINSKGKGTSILSVTCTSEHELFSKYYLEALIAEVSTYYIETKTQRAKNNLQFIQQRTDSTRRAYNQALYGRAAFSDANVNPNREIGLVSGEKQRTDVQLLNASYTELVRSLEAAKTTLMRETPLIQLLDMPVLPLKRNAPGILYSSVLFGLAGGLLITAYLAIRRILQFLMRA